MAPTTITRTLEAPAPAAASPAPVGLGAVPEVVSAGLPAPVVGGGLVDYANFDHAASAPALVAVKKALDTATVSYSSVHRGNGHASRVTSAWFEAARDEVATFVGAREDDIVVFTRHTTESFNLLARALPSGTAVFVFESEHHATLLPWRAEDTVRLPVPRSPQEALGRLESALAASAAAHKLVVVTGASNVTGEVWPVEQVIAVAKRYAARVALDAAQLAPHREVDIAALGVDWVAFSGHKLYAPYGTGVLAGRRDWLDAADPHLAGGGASAAVTRSSTTWQTGAARHEAGSPNVLGAIAVAAACATVRRERPVIEAHEARLFEIVRSGLAGIDGVRAWSLFGDDADRLPVLTITLDGIESSLLSAVLSFEHGIGVRDGKFCAHLLVDRLLDGVRPPTAVRISLGLATTEEHAHRLVAAIREVAAHGPRTAYVTGPDGRWEPAAGVETWEPTPLW